MLNQSYFSQSARLSGTCGSHRILCQLHVSINLLGFFSMFSISLVFYYLRLFCGFQYSQAEYKHESLLQLSPFRLFLIQLVSRIKLSFIMFIHAVGSSVLSTALAATKAHA